MNPTTIEWAKNPDGTPGFTSNPFTGCLGPNGDGNNCPYCYARTLAHGRLKLLYLANEDYAPVNLRRIDMIDPADDPFYPRFWPQRLQDLYIKSPKGIFVCDMSDWCAPWLPMEWKEDLMAAIRRNSQHRIYLLTHQPQELRKWSPYPDNCWVGVTASDGEMAWAASAWLKHIKARIKYMSLEPLLSPLHSRGGKYDLTRAVIEILDWLIIGSMTGRRNDLMRLSSRYPDLTLMPYGKMWTLQPKLEWVKELVKAANQAHIPVFLKDNLNPLLGEPLRQEMPK